MDTPSDVYSASGLSGVVGSIAEMSLPRHPRFVDDLLCLPAHGGVYVLGGDSQYLGGATVRWLFDKLLPQLDGTATVDELRRTVAPQSPTGLDDMLFLLHMHGMLEEGKGPGEAGCQDHIADDTRQKQLVFFSRYLRVTGKWANRYQAQDALNHSHVLVVSTAASAGPATSLAEELSALGVGHVAVAGPLDPWERDPKRHSWTLLVVFAEAATQLALAPRCLKARQPTLFCDTDHLVLGPLTEPGVTACPCCVRHQVGGDIERRPSLPSPILALWQTALVHRAAQRVLSYLTKLFQIDRPGCVEQWRPDEPSVLTFNHVLCLPSCELCGFSPVARHLRLPDGHLENAALLFHKNTCLQPCHLDQPAQMQRHFDLDVIRLSQLAFKQHVGAAAVPLSEPVRDTRSPGWPIGRWGMRELTTILRYSAGARIVPTQPGRFHIRRYTASGGNLGSAEVYVLVRRVEGLPTGLYHYFVLRDELERLPSPPGLKASSSWWAGEPPDVDLVLVSDVARDFAKYGGRGYTYCLLDAGLLAHRINLLAAHVGIRTALLWNFDDEPVNRLLCIEPPTLVPACIIGLGG